MRKCLFTMNISDYAPKIRELTYPLLKAYAKKIGAEFYEIKDRRYPQWPVTYEKLQIYDLAQQMENDWNIYLDADALVHPETIDFTLFMPKNTVAHNGRDFGPIRWRYDNYFMRDGRNIGSCNWCAIASNLCVDLWHPLDDLSLDKAIDNIYPTVEEMNTIVTPEHLIDDYTLSRNIAKYGLKFTTLIDLLKQIGLPNASFFYHQYTISVEEKVEKMKQVLKEWKLL